MVSRYEIIESLKKKAETPYITMDLGKGENINAFSNLSGNNSLSCNLCSNRSYIYMIELFDNIAEGANMAILTIKEEIILSALLMLDGKSSGAPLRKKVIELSRKEIVYGTLYNLLEILIRKGYVTSQKGAPTPVQGGRSKTIYAITREGRQALQETLTLHERIKQSIAGLESGN